MTREEHISNLETIGCDGWTVTTDAYKSLQFAIQVLEQEPCEDAINRRAVLDAITANCIWENEYNLTSSRIKKAVESLPLVNPQPKTGHWITKPHIYGVAFCSECDFELRIDDTKYCPNCGAKMVEPQETETWNGYHGQITAPKGTFERIFNDADDDNDI